MKILFFFLFLTHSLFAESPLSVLIVGGGPAGLATAIEAKMQGLNVTVIEKREGYVRPQTLFLQGSSLKLLEKWKVDTTPIKIADLGEGTLMGFISIQQLEQQLEKRALALGVEKICGEFKGFKPNHEVIVETSKGKISYAYDLIVGADGVHSNVRDALSIGVNRLGTAKGAVVKVLDLEDTTLEVDISPPIKIKGGFLRRTKVPKASLIFGQFPSTASKETLQRALDAQGWSKESKSLGEDKALTGFEIDVFLLQASSFSNREKSAIIIGDAAAAASFFQGMGANTALKTAEVAGHFFKERPANEEAAFQNYDQEVKKLTSELIEDSAFLFI